ncbi:galactitol-1-phosphate 5-dehydrogenase [Faecalicatena orotica]|uniref:(R,R)-butanediol dehydrogenase/meso-butanediol dehydrogenase/diacetyl reductase/L-iditol 2-dehydrogenase n=1 Tax=Faecalicatena orotica TaxID=1544 RepID=A0A2Y9B863_9FIRM|nr:alcohol dehydrogenase catalytic domain-containing protein [Faecalicatena orotica]PWJ31956.1 (R,R)-butanediol dehydrogenase/meso-butanediol dehydrogenase/diacetyl reductase/L-iditol 2-dehydrogenase [Faecalicatena orotica]SSA53784.1 (R,R)-butanediol dehydrogenase / meso-butanediol dehydrogenase / diacetyl reductase/L-iditol 2-dehydrogenase [Faecalicatena orotica]
MKAYCYVSPYKIEEQERETPEPGKGQVRIKVKAVSICGSDTGGFKGTSAMRVAPLVMGHEFSGVVDKYGEGVENPSIPVGGRVVVYPNIQCGECPDCKAGLPNLCEERFIPGTTMPAGGYDGAMADYVVVPAEKLIPIPDSISFEEGSMFEPTSVALRGVKMLSDVKDKVVTVFGAGPIGLLALECLKYLGAKDVICIDLNQQRLEKALECGASHVINSGLEDPVLKVMEITNGKGADAGADCVGIAVSLNTSMKMVRNGGEIAMIGMAAEHMDGFEYKYAVAHEMKLKGSYCYVDELYEIPKMLTSGKINLKKLITTVAPMNQVQKKMEELVSGRSTDVKVVLVNED